jgi:hypothetical protein
MPGASKDALDDCGMILLQAVMNCLDISSQVYPKACGYPFRHIRSVPQRHDAGLHHVGTNEPPSL